MLPFAVLENIGLSHDLFEQGHITAKEISLAADTTVFQSGDPCGAFLIVTSGQLRVDITTKSGRELLLYRMHKHDTCIITTSVLLNHENYYARAITETDVKAIAIPANDFHQALALSHGFSHYILTGYAQRMAALIALLDRITSKDILYELSELLLRHADAKNVVTLTQQDMAREMGTAREVVSRKLSSLDDKGIVSVKRGRVILLKPQQLQKNISL